MVKEKEYLKRTKSINKPAKDEVKKLTKTGQRPYGSITFYKPVDLFEGDMKDKYGKDFSNKMNKKEKNLYGKLLE